MKKRRLLPLSLSVLLLLSACGPKEPEVSAIPPTPPSLPVRTTPAPTPEPTPSPEPGYDGPLNPLTGLPIDEARIGQRPVAIMLNNLEKALPQQGQSQADIIYECLEEGGITRMMGVYQSVEGAGTIGSIRSARTYYLELALGHDAIFIHAGGSDDAYAKIKSWGVTSLDGVRGPYMSTSPKQNLMWRDPDRIRNNGSVHSVVATEESITTLLPTYSIRQGHEDGWSYEMSFADDGTPAAGVDCSKLTVPFSNYKTGVFTYDPDTQLYLAEEYGKPYIDGNTGEQVGVTNVIVVKTAHHYTGDALGHVNIDLSSGGTGYFAYGGKLIDIL